MRWIAGFIGSSTFADISRVERLLSKYPRFAERCFTEAEAAARDPRVAGAEGYTDYPTLEQVG